MSVTQVTNYCPICAERDRAGWITDRKPEKSGVYLISCDCPDCTDHGDGVWICEFWDQCGWVVGHESHKPCAWQPLPDPHAPGGEE